MMMGVSATGQRLFRQVMEGFFCTGTMAFCLKQVGTADRYTEKLNIELNTSASWAAHHLRTLKCCLALETSMELFFKISSHVSHGLGQIAVISSTGREAMCWASLLFIPL